MCVGGYCSGHHATAVNKTVCAARGFLSTGEQKVSKWTPDHFISLVLSAGMEINQSSREEGTFVGLERCTEKGA